MATLPNLAIGLIRQADYTNGRRHHPQIKYDTALLIAVLGPRPEHPS
jgi:hypothetical protein